LDGHPSIEVEELYRVSSTETPSSGYDTVSDEVAFEEGGKVGTGDTVTLRVGEKVIGEGRFDRQVPYRFTVNETFGVGCDTITPISEAHESPCRFTGSINRVLVDVSVLEFQDLAALVKGL
jgi:hypothetical protein